MSYKEFEDFYREASIKHLALFEHNGGLISPPFCTEHCKDYSKILFYNKGNLSFIDINTPPATSKYNSMACVDDRLYFLPYGIWDQFNTVPELSENEILYHELDSSSAGQFYNLASNGQHAFSAPLGYDPVNFCVFIAEGKINQIPFDVGGERKCHMGVVYANGNYYSPPRGESYDYNTILKFDPASQTIHKIEVEGLPRVCRKYSDFIVSGNKLFAMPFGHAGDLSDVLVFDTVSGKVETVNLKLPEFYKKYNTGVLVGQKIICLPYGHKEQNNSKYGLIFDTVTYEYKIFDIGQGFGGKYRFRSGIEYNNCAVYLPVGSPNADIMCININGDIIFRKPLRNYLLGRPVLHENKVCTIAYHLERKDHSLLTIDRNYHINLEILF